jgi:peptidyl-prolyl cis-trans isomerase SDCCAG10
LKHRLTFESDEKLVLAKDANIHNEDTFDIYDPRNPLNKRRRGEEGAKVKHQQQNRRGKPRT